MRYIFLLTFLYFSCQPKANNPKVEALYSKVMEVHDEVMPETSTIHKLKKTLKKSKLPKDSVQFYIKKLNDADEFMMEWMNEFGKYSTMNKESDVVKIKYLESELEKITSVSNEMKSAIAESMKVLNSN